MKEHPLIVANDELRSTLHVTKHDLKEARATIAALQVKLSELTHRIEALTTANAKLQAEAAEADQTIEDVCCGATLTCPNCNKTRPCLCQDT